MKKIVAVLAVLGCVAAFATSAFAFETSADVYAGVADKYLWRGINLSGSQPVLQAGMDVSAGGFTASYWTNTQLSSSSDGAFAHDETTETDIVIDYTFSPVEILSVSVGDIQYNFNVPGNTHEVYLGLGLDTILAPSFTVYYDWDASANAAASGGDLNGLFYSLSVGHDIELPAGLGLSLGAAVNYNDESPFVGEYNEFHNYELSAGLGYGITEQISVDAAVLMSDALSTEAEAVIGKDPEFVSSVAVTLAF